MRSISEIAIARLPEPLAVRLAHWRTRPGAVIWQPGPPGTGDAAAGRRLASGILLFAGHLVETAEADPWDLTAPNQPWADALHGHGWLDDAAAADDPEIWQTLSAWVWGWLDRIEDHSGPAWRPDLVARRMVRWIAYTIPLLRGQPVERSDALFRAMGAHLRYLSGRWSQTRPGGEQIEALSGLVYATISLEGSGEAMHRAIADLGSVASRTVTPVAGIASRNPEELARIAQHLAWSWQVLQEFRAEAAPGHLDALRRAIPVLQSLRSANGRLPRFQGGGDGSDLDLDAILASARGPLAAAPNPAMGFLRLEAGAATAFMDAAPAPGGTAAATAHAGALGIEFTHGNQPIIVSRGPGHTFGEKTARLARLRPSHSSIEIAGTCPASLLPGPMGDLMTVPGVVTGQAEQDGDVVWAQCESTEYEKRFGLKLERRIRLDRTGCALSGDDTALATRAETRARVAACYPDLGDPCAMTLRFHLHPDIIARQSAQAGLIGLVLPDGSRWTFRSDAQDLALAPTRYFDPDRPRPRPGVQIVATSYLIDFWGRITWTLQKIDDGS